MSALHICYIEAAYPHAHGGGGAGTYIRLAGRELVRRGVRVSVIAGWCPHCPARMVDEGITVYRPAKPGNLHWYSAKVPGVRALSHSLSYLEHGWAWRRLLTSLHRRHPISLAEFTEGGDYWHKFRPPFPLVTHLHGSRYTFLRQSNRPVGRRDWWQRKFELAFIRRSRCVFSPSQALLDIVESEMNGPLPEQVILPYPLDPRLLSSPNGTTAESEDAPLVLFAARNDPVKGAAVLLDAVPLIRRKVPQANFLFAGYQPSAGSVLPEGVRCLPFMPKEELLAQYGRATICVIPSLWDNSPNTVYEAMASGRAVVASRVGGIPELVADGETGLLVPPGDAGKLAEAIVRLLLDSSRRRSMGLHGKQRIQRLANLEENITRRLAIYERITATEAPPRKRGLLAEASCFY